MVSRATVFPDLRARRGRTERGILLQGVLDWIVERLGRSDSVSFPGGLKNVEGNSMASEKEEVSFPTHVPPSVTPQ